jgi:hypothetical protein
MMGKMGKHAGPKTLLSAPCGALSRCFSGADDEIRTRDPHLGKVMLYQLSHIRRALRP